MQGLGYRIGRCARQNRNGQQASADNATGKQEKGEHSGDRAQGFGGLGCSVDGHNTLAMQGGGCCEDDGKRDGVGKDHPDHRIPLDAVDMAMLVTRRITQGRSAVELQFLDLLSGLPDEHIRADGCAEHGHHGQRIITGPADLGHDQSVADLDPWHFDGQHSDDIDKEHHRQPFQRTCIAAIGNSDFEHDTEQPKSDSHDFCKQVRTADHQPQSFAHSSEIGGDVDDIGKQNQ